MVHQNFTLLDPCMNFACTNLENQVESLVKLQELLTHPQQVAHIKSAYAMKFHHAKRMAIELMITVNSAIAGMRMAGYFIKP